MSGPGPKYKLPSTIGYDQQDITRRAYPAYSISSRTWNDNPATGTPGPNRYYPSEKISRTGVISSPQPVITSKPDPELKHNGIPAPNRYIPEARPDPGWTLSPSAVILSRNDSINQSGVIPGPKYFVQGTVGAETPDLPREPGWNIVGRTFDYISHPRNSPGPKYPACKLEVYKRKAPEYPLVGRTQTPDSIVQIIPGPKYLGDYQKISREAPSWSFGVKHSDKKTMAITSFDRAPFYGF